MEVTVLKQLIATASRSRAHFFIQVEWCYELANQRVLEIHANFILSSPLLCVGREGNEQ